MKQGSCNIELHMDSLSLPAHLYIMNSDYINYICHFL